MDADEVRHCIETWAAGKQHLLKEGWLDEVLHETVRLLDRPEGDDALVAPMRVLYGAMQELLRVVKVHSNGVWLVRREDLEKIEGQYLENFLTGFQNWGAFSDPLPGTIKEETDA